MIDFLKKHLIIFSFIIIIIFIFITYINNVKELRQVEKSSIRYYNDYCLKLPPDHESVCSYKKGNQCLRYDTDACDYLKKNINNKSKITYDTLAIYDYTTVDGIFYIINFASLILLLFSSLYFIYELFKSKTIINIIQRKGYKTTLKNIFSRCYRYIWFIPLTSIVLLFLCFLASGHFDYSYVTNEYELIFFDYSMNQFLYYILILVYALLLSIFFINIGIIVLRKNHNIIVVLIESFLIYLGIDILTEIVIGNWLCYKVYGYISTFSIIRTIQFMNVENLKYYLTYIFLLVLITFVIVIIKYKNKEKFIIDCEKN